jgi:hypothetical protein
LFGGQRLTLLDLGVGTAIAIAIAIGIGIDPGSQKPEAGMGKLEPHPLSTLLA